jgi:type IV secretion system protein VirB3
MQAEAIYKGATRPAMKLGIPLVPLVILFGTGMLLIPEAVKLVVA